MITKTYSSGVDGMKDHIFDCSGYKDSARLTKTQRELSNYILRSSEKGELDIAKTVSTLKTESLKPTAPSKEAKLLGGIEKDVWMDNYQTEA